MAPRSYLARVAQPLTAADPIVWSAPRAAPEDARPVNPAAAPASVAERTPLRTPPMSSSPAVASGRRASSVNPSPTSSSGVEPLDQALLGPSMTASDASPASIEKGATAQVEPAVGKRNGGAAARHDGAAASERSPGSATTFDAAPDGPARPRLRDTALVLPDVLAHSRANADGGGLHIGTIEIHVAPPPPPAPAPVPVAAIAAPPAGEPIARSYASRFGLAQG